MKQIPILHYRISGHGPTVILLHGYMASSRYWDKTAAVLSQKHRVIAIDLLGFGQSPKPGCSRYDLAAQRASLDATLNLLDITKKFTLIGHSMGSLIALNYANHNPSRIKKLVLTNMPVFSSRNEARTDIYSTRLLYRFALKPGLHNLIWPIFKTIIQLRLMPARARRAMTDHRRYMFQSNSFARVRSMRNLIFQARVEADLRSLNVKTVILSGLSDRAVYLRNLTSFQLSSRIQSQIVIGGHHLPQTNPQLIASLI